MGNEFNKTEADFTYERYTKMRESSPEQDIPLENNDPIGAAPIDFDGIADDGADPALVEDHILAADIGLSAPEPGLRPRAERHGEAAASPETGRDELLESDAVFAAGAAGLTGSVIDYAADEEVPEDEEEVLPLEDIPDADELQPGTAVDPASPPLDVMHGTDLLNGSNGEEE
jgi:hypothetical protein